MIQNILYVGLLLFLYFYRFVHRLSQDPFSVAKLVYINTCTACTDFRPNLASTVNSCTEFCCTKNSVAGAILETENALMYVFWSATNPETKNLILQDIY